MKFIQVNDVHLSDKAPRWRIDSYADDVFAKLAWVGDHAKHIDADVVVFAGDLFHNPTPHRTSHAIVQRVLEIIDAYPCPVVVVPGNHDLSHGSLESLARQPLGVVARHPKVTLLSSENPVYDLPSGRQLVGLEWQYAQDIEWYRGQLERISKEYADGHGLDAVILHAAVADRPNPFYGTLLSDDLAGFASYVGYGHLHPPDPIRSIGKTTFGNPGALSRGSISASDLERTPQVAVVSITDKGTVVEYVECAVAKPAADVFRLEVALQQQEDSEKIEQFVQELGTTTIETVNLDSLVRTAESLAESPRVAELCREILMGAL